MRKFRWLLCAGLCLSPSVFAASNTPAVEGWWSIPFMLLLSSIAFVPFIHKPFWERFFGHISIGLGLIVSAIYLTQLGAYGHEKLGETALEYFKFIALIGSLFVVCGGILIDVSGGGNPRVNTLLLATGVLLANIVGTTGASMLLIRPFRESTKTACSPFTSSCLFSL